MKQILTILFLLSLAFTYAVTINVPDDQPTIQAGITASANGDTVLVQPGTYIENINYNGKNITVASLFITTQDSSFISQTIIDGNQNNSVIIYESGEDSTAVLTGFTITNGYTYNSGGGIYCFGSSPRMENLTIANNSSGNWGGGIHLCWDSNPSLDNLIIIGNSSYNGGGIYCGGSNPVLENVAIVDNSAYGWGGGIYCGGSNPVLENVTISGNSTEHDGGGIYCHNSNPSLVNVTITNNSATYWEYGGYGGGIFCTMSNPSLEYVTITNNIATYSGGGICCNYSSPSLVNVTITNNSGGGISCNYSSNPSLENVTISSNSTNYDGGGIYCRDNSNPSLINCIMWNDTPEEIYFDEYNFPNSITLSYSDIQGGEVGIVTNNNGIINWLEGNIDEDPLFVDLVNGDYHLTENSPCIDAGDPSSSLDPDGTIADMGAFYFHQLNEINENEIPISEFDLSNYPNPFNPSTTISFTIQEDSKIELSVYNIKGQKIKSLLSDQIAAGKHSIVWNGEDASGKKVSSGIYLYKLQTQAVTQTRKMLLLK